MCSTRTATPAAFGRSSWTGGSIRPPTSCSRRGGAIRSGVGTLVIDTIGYNDKFWFDSRGTPHTTQLHTIERWTRTNYGTMINEFTLDDPGALEHPVQLKFTAHAQPPGSELMEFICTENNQYGVAADIPNIYRDKGYGLEVEPPAPKK